MTLNPGACANAGGIGTQAWSSGANAQSDDGVYASASVDGTTTNYLICSNYGFAVPAGSRIDGITVNVERKSDRISNNGSNDATMRIVKGGAVGAADRATASIYSVLDFTEPHGGATDLWGETWTAADINAAGFGAAFAAVKPTANGPAHLITVDRISITVDYTPPPTVSSILRAGADPTSAASVSWTATFSEAVFGVDTGDFVLLASGLSGPSITSVIGGPIIYIVTADTSFGVGTLGLNLADNDSIIGALTAVPLSGVGVGNGDFTGQVYNVNRPPPVASFNVVEQAADPLTGRIFTKVAGADVVVDIVALDSSNAVSTSFTGAVAVELVDNSSGGACAGLPLIKALANQAFVATDNGRHALSPGQLEAEAYRNVKFRIKYPVGAPTVTSCSGDAFANRPAVFQAVQVSHLNRTTAGIGPLLASTANPGSGEVHNAGRPFRIVATAQNNSGAANALYVPPAGEPRTVLSQCGGGIPAACLPLASLGSLNPGAWSAAGGVITTPTATYSNVGSFDLVLEDQSFSAVDDADGTLPDVRYIRSTALSVGRFVPDHFAITGTSITPRSDLPACSGSSFTYMDERMDLVFTLRARAFGGADTAGYEGALGALALNNPASYNFGAIDGATPIMAGRLDLSFIPGIATSWTTGTAGLTVPFAITRNASPDGPFGALRIGIAPSDLDGVTLGTLDLDADNSGSNERGQVGGMTQVRFGRLRMENAVGSEKLDLPIPIQLQYWAATAFQVNAADSCTPIAAANIQLSDHFGGIDNTNVTSANLSPANLVFASGVGNLTLTKPLPAPSSPGAVTLTVNLTAEAKSYLKGNWGVATYTADPRSRAAFGLYGGQPGNFLYFRENY